MQREYEDKDAYWSDLAERDLVFYSTVSGFKGLERPAVVLVVDGFHEGVEPSNVMYTRMSRARDLLVVVGAPEVVRSAVSEGVMRRLEGVAVDGWLPCSHNRVLEDWRLDRGETVQAQDLAELHEAASSGDVEAIRKLVQALFRQGDKEGADSWIEYAAELGDPTACAHHGWNLAEAGELEAARPYLEVAARAGDAESMSNLGVVCKRLGDRPSARAWYERSAAAGVKAAAANLAIMYAEVGMPGQAQFWEQVGQDD